MVESKLWYLQRIKLFKELTPQEVEELDRIARMVSVKKNEAIYYPGDPSRGVYILKSGRVKISRLSKGGREVTVALLKPGEVFGELEILSDTSREDLAMALDDSQLCVIQKELFLSMVRQKPEICFSVTKLIGTRMGRIESLVENLVFRDVHSRLAYLLVDLSKNYGKRMPEGIRLEVKLTQQEIANLIGSSRETVSSVLGELKNEGLIICENRQITLPYLDRLKKLI